MRFWIYSLSVKSCFRFLNDEEESILSHSFISFSSIHYVFFTPFVPISPILTLSQISFGFLVLMDGTLLLLDTICSLRLQIKEVLFFYRLSVVVRSTVHIRIFILFYIYMYIEPTVARVPRENRWREKDKTWIITWNSFSPLSFTYNYNDQFYWPWRNAKKTAQIDLRMREKIYMNYNEKVNLKTCATICAINTKPIYLVSCVAFGLSMSLIWTRK